MSDPRDEERRDAGALREAEESHAVEPGEVREEATPEVREGEREE